MPPDASGPSPAMSSDTGSTAACSANLRTARRAAVEAGTPRLRIGADGAIYIAAGARNASDADSLGSYAGKVLRFTPDGAAPNDNPVRGSPVFSIGYAGRLDLAWSRPACALARRDGRSRRFDRSDGERTTWAGRAADRGATSADAAFHSGDIPAAWRGSLLIASPTRSACIT